MNHWKLFGQPGHGFCDKEETRKVSLHCTAPIAWNSHIASSEARRFFSRHISPHKTETTTYDHQPSPGSSSNIRLTFELASTRWHFGACCYWQIVENVEGLKGSLTSAGRFARLSLEDLIGSRFWSDPLCGSVENSIPTISCHVLQSELTRVKFRLGKFWLPASMARKMSVHLCHEVRLGPKMKDHLAWLLKMLIPSWAKITWRLGPSIEHFGPASFCATSDIKGCSDTFPDHTIIPSIFGCPATASKIDPLVSKLGPDKNRPVDGAAKWQPKPRLSKTLPNSPHNAGHHLSASSAVLLSMTTFAGEVGEGRNAEWVVALSKEMHLRHLWSQYKVRRWAVQMST